MPISDAQKKATSKWQKNNTTMITIRLQNLGDKDIISYLEERERQGLSKAGAFKDALREKMAREQQQ